MSWPIQNMYTDVLDPKYLDKPRTFERQRQIQLNLLSIFIIVGSTGSFKTNSALQIILAYSAVWDSFTLCAKTLDEPLYNWFRDYMAQQKRQGHIKWYQVCDDLLDLPPLDRPKQPGPLLLDRQWWRWRRREEAAGQSQNRTTMVLRSRWTTVSSSMMPLWKAQRN